MPISQSAISRSADGADQLQKLSCPDHAEVSNALTLTPAFRMRLVSMLYRLGEEERRIKAFAQEVRNDTDIQIALLLLQASQEQLILFLGKHYDSSARVSTVPEMVPNCRCEE